MIALIEFKPEHLQMMIVQEQQAWMDSMMKDQDYGAALVSGGPCFTLLDDERVVICAGLVHLWENRSQAWAVISRDAGRHFVRIVRAMRAFLDQQTIRRIETTVDSDFMQGHRLMQMIGFQREGLMKHYAPDGRDCVLYARVA